MRPRQLRKISRACVSLGADSGRYATVLSPSIAVSRFPLCNRLWQTIDRIGTAPFAEFSSALVYLDGAFTDVDDAQSYGLCYAMPSTEHASLALHRRLKQPVSMRWIGFAMRWTVRALEVQSMKGCHLFVPRPSFHYGPSSVHWVHCSIDGGCRLRSLFVNGPEWLSLRLSRSPDGSDRPRHRHRIGVCSELWDGPLLVRSGCSVYECTLNKCRPSHQSSRHGSAFNVHL